MAQQYDFRTSGVCSSGVSISIDGNIIKSVKFTGGCPGNLLGIGKLVENRKIDDVIADLNGICCGGKSTSCPDQLSKALTAIKADQDEKNS